MPSLSLDRTTPNRPTVDHPRTRSAFRTVRTLLAGYFVLSLATVVAIVLMRHDPSRVTSAVWTRGVIVLASSILTSAFAARAAAGAPRAYLRLRLISAIMVVAVAVIIALPGAFPLWMKLEQGACGLLLLGVVALVNGRHLRSVFAGR